MALDVRRKYDAQLILSTVQPWKPPVWKKLAPILAPIFGPPAKTAVRTGPKLGKLGWDDAKKWTAKRIDHLEMWSPSWSQMGRLGRPPEAFLHLVDPTTFGDEPTDGVASYVLLAVAADSDVHAAAVKAFPALAKALAPVQRYAAHRAWARSTGAFFENSLQDALLMLERNERTGKLRIPAAWKPKR